MKILWLSNYKKRRQNNWYHYDFAKALAKRPDVELKTYGKDMSIGHPEYNLQPLDLSIKMKDLKKQFDFDVIIMDGRWRFFIRQSGGQNWLPRNFDKFNKVPKIMIEGDYHNFRIKKWYQDRKIDIILHRHKSNVAQATIDLPEIKHIWFPCSVDNKIFKPNSNIERQNKLYFIGGLLPCYIYRKKAIKILKEQNLIKVFRRAGGQKYIEILQSSISHLNCSSKFHIDTAKMFEIMSSGSVLFTDDGDDYGLKELFPANSYVTYKRDFSDVISKAKKIISKSAFRKRITTRALNCIAKKHTHKVRIKELLKIIEKAKK